LSTILAELAEKDLVAAERFLGRIEHIAARLARHPNAFQEVSERPGVRRVPLLRYPYLMFYRVIADEIIILRIVHGARNEPWAEL
jgi:plasmid stabilization system protein ParE